LPDSRGGRSPERLSGRTAQHGPLDRQGDEVERAAQYRKLTAKQKLEIVLVGLRGERSVRDLCREHEISETLYYRWRDQLLEVGGERLGGRRSAEASRS
jgi:transposase-like protein